MIEICLPAKAIVPEKYKHVLHMMMDDPKIWQNMADQMIQSIRETAAKAGMEVDDLITQIEEQGKQK